MGDTAKLRRRDTTTGKLPFLLENQGYSCELPGESVDFRSWATRTFGDGIDREASGSPWLLIITRADDREADRVGLRLTARGFPYRRVDVDALSAAGLTLSIGPGTVEGRLRFGQTAAMGSPDVVWLRHFNVSAVHSPVEDPMVGAFLRSEWDHAVRSLLSLEHTRWINRPDAVLSLGRVAQIRLADRVGLYPCVMNVEGVEPGIYHYSVKDHELESVSRADPRERMSEMCGDQA